MEFQKEVKSGFKWTSLSMLGGSLLQFLQVVILARLLDPADFGVFALTLVFIRFCQPMVELGFGAAIVQRQDLKQVQISTLFWLNYLLAVVFFFALYFFSPLLAGIMEAPILSSILPVLALSFLIIPLGIQPQAFLQKKFQFKKLTVVGLLGLGADFILSIGFALYGFGAWSMVYGFLGKILINALGMIWYGHYISDLKPRFEIDFPASKELIHFGMFDTGGQLLNLGGIGIEKLIIGKILGLELLGIYTVIWDLVTLPYGKLNPIFTKVYFPLMSKVADTATSLKNSYDFLFKGILLINIPIYAILISFPNEVLVLGFGEKWGVGDVCLMLMGVYGFFRGLLHPGLTLFLSTGKTKISFIWNLIWVCGSLTVLGIMLSLSNELESIGFSYIFSLVAFYWIWVLLLIKFGNINWFVELKLISKHITIPIIILTTGVFLYSQMFDGNFIVLGIVVIIFLLIYSWSVWILEKGFLTELWEGFKKSK